jgi:hypothetical protein
MPRKRLAIPKSDPNQKPKDAVAGIIGEYYKKVLKLQAEKAKPKREQDKEFIKNVTAKLSELDEFFERQGCDIQAEIEKLKNRGVR